MSTYARKTRKRSGEKFAKAPKIGTPLEDRSLGQPIIDRASGRIHPSHRKFNKMVKRIEARDGVKLDGEDAPE